MSSVVGPFGRNGEAFPKNGEKNGLQGGKLTGEGWNVAGDTNGLLTDRIVESGRDGAGLFLISCLRHLERRFWNQT